MNINSQIQNYRDAITPQKSWLFSVEFFFEPNNPNLSVYRGIAEESNNGSFILNPINVDLPNIDYKKVTKNYLGTQKSFIVGVDRSGTTNMEFYLRPVGEHVKANERVLFLDYLKGFQREGEIRHDYLTYPQFSKIRIKLLLDNMDVWRVVTLINPLVTKISHGGNLGYNSDDIVKWSMTVDYDWWE